MLIRAKYKGKPGDCGYESGATYVLHMDIREIGPVEIIRICKAALHPALHPAIKKESLVLYASLPALLDNWEILR